MKKIMIVLLFLWGGCLYAQVPQEIDPNWGWQPKQPCLSTDTAVIDTAYVLMQEISIDSIPNINWSDITTFKTYNHYYTSKQIEAVQGQLNDIEKRLKNIEHFLNGLLKVKYDFDKHNIPQK